MGTVHYFQRFSTQENVDTNNTLLLLSRIQATDPRLLRAVLSELLEDESEALQIGVQFSQQTAGPKSVPDGMLFQPSFRLVVETKRAPAFEIGQLEKHLLVFGAETTKILLLLAPSRVQLVVPTAKESQVTVVSRSFADVVAACRSAGVSDNLVLADLVDDFESYCFDAGLMSDEKHRMMVVSVGTTSAENRAHRIYYCPAERGFRKSRFLGLYWSKQVRAIAEVENIVCANMVGKELQIIKSSSPVSKAQEKSIRSVIDLAPAHGYDIASGHRFFLTSEFADTSFKKASAHGLLGKRYFNLRDELELSSDEALPELVPLAAELSERTWE